MKRLPEPRHALIAAATAIGAVIGCASPSPPPTAPTTALLANVPEGTIPAGTRLQLNFDTDLGPGLDRPGDLVRGFLLTRLVDSDGHEVVPYGAVWEGHVVTSDLAARTITIAFDRVQSTTGWVPFTARIVSASPYALTVRTPVEESQATTMLLGRTAGAIGGGPPVEGAPTARDRTLTPEVVVPYDTPVDVVLTEPIVRR